MLNFAHQTDMPNHQAWQVKNKFYLEEVINLLGFTEYFFFVAEAIGSKCSLTKSVALCYIFYFHVELNLMNGRKPIRLSLFLFGNIILYIMCL